MSKEPRWEAGAAATAGNIWILAAVGWLFCVLLFSAHWGPLGHRWDVSHCWWQVGLDFTLLLAGGLALAGLAVWAASAVRTRIADLTKQVRQLDAAFEEVRIARDSEFRVREALQEVNARLSAETDRTTELARATESANAAKSQFLANMSHEIRTPMTAILGFAELMEGDLPPGPEGDGLRLSIAAIRRNGDFLLRLINEMLDLSQIESGNFDLEFSPCSPGDLLREVVDLFRETAQAKGIELQAASAPDVPSAVRTDPVRLKQILINLLSNAVKFTEVGRVVVHLSLRDERSLVYRVVDTGIGMREAHLQQLFQPFVQADSSMTRKYGGSGLGLTISRRLVDRLGGQMVVESCPEVGSVFEVVVPVELLRQEDSESPGVEPAAERPAAKPRPLANRRILLAEDGPDNQRIISMILRRAGATVEIAANGEEALQEALRSELEPHPFDVILMDMQMPVRDGYSATTALRTQGYSRPILALTAHAMDGDKEKCLAAGCDDYGSKPVNRAALIDLVQRHCGFAIVESGATAAVSV